MSEKEQALELERKLERNQRSFEAWLERKVEEQRKKREAERKTAELAEEQRRWQLEAAQLAYQRWLQVKQEQDELLKKEKEVGREIKRLQLTDRAEERQRSQETFRNWKEQKDLELRLRRQLEQEQRRALTPPARGPTPPLPGYCSVWSCDEELAEIMLDKVPRGTKLFLGTQNYHQFITPNSKNLTV